VNIPIDQQLYEVYSNLNQIGLQHLLVSGQAACIYTDVVDELFKAVLTIQFQKDY